MIKTELQSNNLDLRALLDAINNLPEKGSGSGEDISEELTAQDALISEISSALDEVAVAQADAFAAIGVTYSEGSTCTCSCGDITLTAKNTSGQALFLVPSAGEWTVTATQGTNTKSQSVEITTEGQLESVELSYIFWLYKDGVQNVEWVALNAYNASVTFGADKIITTGAGSWGEHGIHTKEKINLSGYKTLHLYGRVTNKIVDDTARDVQKLGLVEATTDYTSIAYTANYSSYVTIGTELKEYDLDVSAINEEYYVAIGGVNDTEIYRIGLE